MSVAARSSVAEPSARLRAEESALHQLIRRLVEQFPEVDEDEIVRAVHGRYEQFEDSRIRDFVPVLVERAVRTEIVAQVPRHRA
jgi:hypothetical protein